jgi:ech hydrogenase subunit B
MKSILFVLGYIVLAPILGGLLAGFDRIVTARMQTRKGPPIAQPFYDVFKLLGKRSIMVNTSQNFYVILFLVFIVFTGALFFGGGDLLLTIFALTVAGIFLALGAYSAASPYSKIGAERELLQMMAYEPMILIMAIAMYQVTKSFHVYDIAAYPATLAAYLPGVFVGFIFILTIKLRKSPFDLSTSHHGHQELVKGLTTEFSGPTLAIIEIAHWYENILLMGFVYLFFAGLGPIAAVAITIVAYLFEILIDNTFARLTWRVTVRSSWVVALLFGAGNVIILCQLIR